ncbi:hypothetical protein ACJMK2_019247 [Sinanodonta woodiana]|uniref:DUF5745 domain-containing protein n=1 Tax=Sinanodonta woodiana TaxID=1069815 RepID=A0ABD3UFW5_SINWO
MAQSRKSDKSDQMNSVADILSRTNTLAPFIWRRAHVTRLDLGLILHLILATFERIIGQDLPANQSKFNTEKEKAGTLQRIINTLEDCLHEPISHITGENLVAGNQTSLIHILDICIEIVHHIFPNGPQPVQSDPKQDEELKLEDLKDLDQGQECMPENVVTSKLGGRDAYEDKTAPKIKKHAYEKKNVAFTKSRGPTTSTFRKRIISTKVRKRSLSGTPSPLSDLLSPLRIREPSKHPLPTARRPSVNERTARASRYESILRDHKSIVSVAAKLPAAPSETKVRPKSQRQRAQNNLLRPIIPRFSQTTNESFEYKGRVSPDTSYVCRSLRAGECLDHLTTRLNEIRHRRELMTNEEKHIVNAMKSMLEDASVKDKKKPKTISSYRIPKR